MTATITLLGRPLDSDRALKDLYEVWKTRLKKLIKEEMMTGGTMH